MTIPSFSAGPHGGIVGTPRIRLLAVRARENPDGEPIIWLWVERKETFERDSRGKILKASIHLSFAEMNLHIGARTSRGGSFAGSYRADSNTVSLATESGGSGYITIDMPEFEGNRIGTYLMNEIVTWARHWPDAQVNEIRLLHGQAVTEDKKVRRNRFYRNFNVEFVYTDESKTEGYSLPMLAKDLGNVETWRSNIVEHGLPAYLSDLHYRAMAAESDVEVLKRENQALRDQLRAAEDARSRWRLAIARLGRRAMILIPVMVAAAVAVVLVGAFR